MSVLSWKNKTCELCTFRVGDECRRFPPQLTNQSYAFEDGRELLEYPSVHEVYDMNTLDENHFYWPACAEYSELLQPLTIKEETR